MPDPVMTQPEAAAEPSSRIPDLLKAAGLDDSLPERLIRTPHGHAFEPTQLFGDDKQSILDQWSHLIRREPVGGFATLIATNCAQVRTQFQTRLAHHLTNQVSAHRLLRHLQARLTTLIAQCETAVQEIDRDYREVQESLTAWQDWNSHQGTNRLSGWAHWVMGGPGRISLPQAVTLWNDREYLALERAARRAALDLVTQICEDVGTRLNRLSSQAAEARQLAETARESLNALRQPPTAYQPWTLRVDELRVVDQLLAQIDLDQLASTALSRLSATQSLAEVMHTVVTDAVTRCCSALDIAQVIEIEAQALLPDADTDGLLLVGQSLLDALNQQSSWLLTPDARPRIENVQVTAHGLPVFSLDGLSTAAGGHGDDYLAFVQVQLAVAPEELRLLQDGRELFADALRQRNLYVIEELARAAPPPEPEEAQPETHAPTVPELTAPDGAGTLTSSNGVVHSS